MTFFWRSPYSMPSNLTIGLKRRYIKLIVQRDGGYKCFYCDRELQPKKDVFDHLNDNRRDNRPDNLVLACQSCNIKKANDKEMENIALNKLDENENGIFVGENFPNLKEEEQEENGTSKEIQINEKNYDIVEQFITEEIEKNASILYSDTLNSSVYLCKQKTGHGSHNSVRYYIDTLTSPRAPYEKIGKGKDKRIVKRFSN